MSESRFHGSAPEFRRRDQTKPQNNLLKRIGIFAAGIAIGVPAAQEANKAHDRYQAEQERASIEKEVVQTKEDIRSGLQDQVKFANTMHAYNALVESSRTLDAQSEAYKKIVGELNVFSKQMDPYRTVRGEESLGLIESANAYATALESNPAAMHNLAVVRTLYHDRMRQTGHRNAELNYWHNFAAAYQELGKKSETELRRKFESLFAYAKTHAELNLSKTPHEQILFFLLEDQFDLSLTPETVRTELERRDPAWAQEKATHVNKDTYKTFNDLTALDIFELNQLHAVVTQLNNPEFQASVFSTRDQDLSKTDTEVGGLIPRPEQDHVLHSINASKSGNNESYVKPSEGAILQFVNLAEFHFHATRMEEEENVQGPSGADFNFFAPAVVFSSVDAHTVRAHFYVSRAIPDGQPLNDVISLGTVTQP